MCVCVFLCVFKTGFQGFMCIFKTGVVLAVLELLLYVVQAGLKLRDMFSFVPALPSYSQYLTVLILQVEVLGSERCIVIERVALRRTHLQSLATYRVAYNHLNLQYHLAPSPAFRGTRSTCGAIKYTGKKHSTHIKLKKENFASSSLF